MKLLTESSGILGINRPDFVHLNASVKTYASSVVWIHQPGGTGSGFAIGNNAVATNRHVVTSEPGGKVIAPRDLRIVSKNGVHTAQSIHLPDWGPDDIAIIILAEDAKLVPFNIGFSELVEVGERILTLGFPAAHAGAFEENLYCNVGLVNRIRPSEFCSERVLEVSIELQGGISGAPVLNEMGEVVGLVTFTLTKTQRNQEGQMHFERSFHAIPVELLRRLKAKIGTFDE
jgi:molecular chaperone DnaK